MSDDLGGGNRSPKDGETAGKHPRQWREPMLFRMFRWYMYFLVAVPILTAVNHLFLGLHIEEKEEITGIRSGIVVCNHIHPLDATMVACGFVPHRLNIAALNKNMEKRIAGKIVTLFGTAVGENFSGHKQFLENTTERLIAGEWFLIFPEGEMIMYDTTLRPFRNGAFLIASRSGVPVIPMVLALRPVSGLRALIRRKPLFTLRIGTPLWPDARLDEKQNVEYLRNTAFSRMSDMLGDEGGRYETAFGENAAEAGMHRT